MENNILELIDPSQSDNDKRNRYFNPFFVDRIESEHKYTKIKFLLDLYDFVYIICISESCDLNEENINRINLFFNEKSTIEELNEITELVTLVRGSTTLLFENTIRTGIITIEKKYLEPFNHNAYDLKEQEIVYLMLKCKESNMNKLITKLSKISEYSHWKYQKNCYLDINEDFAKRCFNVPINKRWKKIDEIEKEVSKIINSIELDEKFKGKISNYQQQLETSSNISEVKMPDLGYDKKHISFFEIVKVDGLKISKETIDELFINFSLTDKEKYYLMCYLLINKDYCHYVINNKIILEKMETILTKFKPIFRYLIGYSWISLYLEECRCGKRIKQNDRFVFDIETVSKLPNFPYSYDNIRVNPYISCLISDELLNISRNYLGVKQSLSHNSGTVNLSEFKRRLNIFISGFNDLDVFEGCCWDNMVITGSIMAAIIPKYNPLMELFKHNTVDINTLMTDEELIRYYQEYYVNADIDIACNHTNTINYIEHIIRMKDIIYTNLNKKYKEIKKSDIEIIPSKTLAIYVNSTLLKKKCESGEIPFDYDYIINNRLNNDIQLYFWKKYIHVKTEANENNEKILKKKINETPYFKIIDYVSIAETNLIIQNFGLESYNDYRTAEKNSGIQMVYYIKDDQDIFIKFGETMKYKIKSSYLKHVFEFFRISEVEFFSTIARFHLPCVRSYYNGKTCYLLPSAITAYQTFLNIDFKYFVGNRDPINIINKYRERGYGIILNENELKLVLSYSCSVGDYKKAYGIKDKEDIKKLIGQLDISNCMFKPRMVVPERYIVDTTITTKYNDVYSTYIESYKDIEKYYISSYSQYAINLLQHNPINKNGTVNPVKLWMIEAAYDD